MEFDAEQALDLLHKRLYDYARECILRDLYAAGAGNLSERDDVIHDYFASRAPGTPIPNWYEAMTAILDVSVCVEKLGLAMDFIELSRDAEPFDDGMALLYHADAWAIHLHALCDKVAHLFTKIYRDVLSPHMGDWSIRLGAAKQVAAETTRGLAKMRNGIAHERHYGVLGIEHHHRWEDHVLLDRSLSSVVRDSHSYFASLRPMYVDTSRKQTRKALAALVPELSFAADAVRQASEALKYAEIGRMIMKVNGQAGESQGVGDSGGGSRRDAGSGV